MKNINLKIILILLIILIILQNKKENTLRLFIRIKSLSKCCAYMHMYAWDASRREKKGNCEKKPAILKSL